MEVLTQEDLEALTGRKRKDKQIEELIAMEIRFKPTKAGFPKVLWAEVNRVMLGGSTQREEEPNFDALHG